ncbi:MAG: CotH kinase family protein [Flavobacteriia bacterium]|jgi:hypothetical protein
MKTVLCGLVFLKSLLFFSQTFTASPNDTILDDHINEYPILISGLPNSIDTNNFGLESICLTLAHTYIADLSISLIAPDGTSVLLSSGVGGETDSLSNTCFSMDATQNIGQGSTPFTGVFLPFGQMGILNNLQNPNGTWILRVHDSWTQDAGNIFTFSLTFGSNPASLFTIHDSSLPIVMLQTSGQEIPNEPKLDVDLKIIYNGQGNRNFVNQLNAHFSGNCGVEIRGASSSGMPKKSYDIEIRDLNGLDLDTAILEFPSESDWVLSAQYTDKTLIRNMLSMHLLQSTGKYAPRFRPVELFINNEYKGVYIFMEKVKRGNDRIDIAKLDSTEISGDNLTGGYIIKLDKDSGNSNPGWESPFAPIPAGSSIVLDYNYPDGNFMPQVQKDYIKNYITDFETALASTDFMDPNLGYRAFVDYTSCLDALIVSEVTKSIDAYRKSFFLYKDKDSKGGKLTMAPIWDYDLTYGNADFCEGQNPEGWQYNFNYVCGGDYWINPFWFPRMMEDTIYKQDLACRWKTLRESSFHNDSIFAWIDSMALTLNESQNWNYQIWPTMGTYVWPNSFVGENYQEEIDFMKSWILQRMTWLDNNIPGDTTFCPHASLNKITNNDFEIFPNPVENLLRIKSSKLNEVKNITIKTSEGKIVKEVNFESTNFTNLLNIEISNLGNGIYFLELITTDQSQLYKFIKR